MNMKKIFLFFVLVFMFSAVFSDTYAQRNRGRTTRKNRTATRRNTGNTFRFTEDMENRIEKLCPKRLSRAPSRRSVLEAYCPISNVRSIEADLGPFEKFVKALEKLFKQIRPLLYTGAVFMIMWILVQAAYGGDMQWNKVIMLVAGVVILSIAEVLINIATKRVVLEDVIGEGVYVDCRNISERNVFYKCASDARGSALYDSRYFLKISGTPRNAGRYKGLF